MSRPKDDKTNWKMRPFTSAGKQYAITINPGIGKSGKWCSNIKIWGSLSEDLKFSPNIRFYSLSAADKKKFIYPDNWDITDSEKSVVDSSENKNIGPDCSLLYGDTLFLDKIVDSCNLRTDLEQVFGSQITSQILTIAYFWLISDKNLNRLFRDFAVQWFPCDKPMKPYDVTRLSQIITKENIDNFMALRKARFEENGLWFGVDSTSISNYSSYLADSKWGKNKENDICKQLNLMVMYDMISELPVHYRKLPGNIPDARTLRLLFGELKSQGFKKFGLILDRAYLTKENLNLFITEQIQGIFMAKTNDKVIQNEIIKITSDASESIADEDNYLEDFDCYGKECVYPYSIKETDTIGRGTAVNQRICLFFDPELQGAECKEITKTIKDFSEALKQYQEEKTVLNKKTLKSLSKYFDITLDESGCVESFEKSKERITLMKKKCGFFAIVCCNIPKEDKSIEWVLSTYRKRDLQEKAFTYLKTWQNGRKLRTSTELSTTGRVFSQFITLIINSQLHHLYFKTSKEFRKDFNSPWEVLDEMRSVKLIRLKNRKDVVSEFVGKQVNIFDEFGFDIPNGSRPVSKSKPKSKPKNNEKEGA